jgi:hypothetical protein
VLLGLICLALLVAPSSTARSELREPASHQSDGSVIAYVGSSTDNQSIRQINPDGSGDRELWRVPTPSHPVDGVGTLRWRPDSGELLFDSGHDWQRSMATRDLYAVGPFGTGLRRISSPPGPEGYADLPKGTVTFVVDANEDGDVQAYIQGALAPVSYVARVTETYRITMEVADLGPGVRQYIRIWDPEPDSYPCLYSEAAWADVVAGQVVDLGVVTFHPVTSDMACWHMFSPSWSHDGERILYLFREPTTLAFPEYAIWETSPRAGVNLLGTRLYALEEFASNNRFYKLAFAPTAARSNELVILQNEALYDLLWYATTDDLPNRRQLDLGGCPRLECDLLDVVWLPDGSGLLIARAERGSLSSPAPPEGGAIYRYSFDDGALDEILRLPGELIGKLAVAPDGSAIAFERDDALVDRVEINQWGPSLRCPCSIWRVDADGDNLTRLVADGRAPAWSLTAPPPAPMLTLRAWLPLLNRR